jgi:hypothetical protein
MERLQHRRSVRVQTLSGAVDGDLQIGERLRTLDDLNLVAKTLVTLHSSRLSNTTWPFSEGTLSVNKASILFVIELKQPPIQTGASFGRFTRSSVSLRVGEYDIRGFVHVPPGGVVIKRLDQSNHPFLSLTSALVTGPTGEFTTPFIAVNRHHIIAAQEQLQVETSDQTDQATAGVGV